MWVHEPPDAWMQLFNLLPGMAADFVQGARCIDPLALAVHWNLKVDVIRLFRKLLAPGEVQGMDDRTTVLQSRLQIVDGIGNKPFIGKIAPHLEDAWS